MIYNVLQESGILNEEQKKQPSEKTLQELESHFIVPRDKLKVCTKHSCLECRDDDHFAQRHRHVE